MSLCNKIRNKAKPETTHKPIIDSAIRCKPGHEKEFTEALKNKFPGILPLIRELKNYGMIDGLRNVSYRLNDEYKTTN